MQGVRWEWVGEQRVIQGGLADIPQKARFMCVWEGLFVVDEFADNAGADVASAVWLCTFT